MPEQQEPKEQHRVFLYGIDPEDHNLPAAQPGQWVAAPDFLSTYGGDIHLEGELLDTHVAHSVPSVFARPIQFYQALKDTKNPLHKAIESEWRGLLAVFALNNHLNLKLEAKLFEVPSKENEIPDDGSIGGIGDGHLMTSLRSQLPKPESDWEKWWLLKCDEKLIGATCPWTVVYTPANYRCPESILWKTEDRLLVDPISYYSHQVEGRHELFMLLRWVESVLEAHRWGMKHHLEEKVGIIRRELQSWQKDLKEAIKSPSGGFDEKEYRNSAEGKSLLDTEHAWAEDFYKHFLVPLAVPPVDSMGTGHKESDLLLAASKESEAILALSRTTKLSGKRVLGSFFADQIDFSRLKGPIHYDTWEAKAGQEIPHPYLIVEDMFLPPKLLEMKLADDALYSNKGYATPLTPAFFKYFSHEDLTTGRVGLEMQPGDKSVMVTLSVPLRGGGKLRVKKEYAKGTGILAAQGPTPALVHWPNFYAEDWNENFALYYNLETDLLVAPLLADGSLLEKTKEDESQNPLRIWPTEQAPIGFALHSKDSGTDVDVGLVLRGKLPKVADINPARQWEVAVDFGTSNTHIMKKEEGKITPLFMTNRTILLTAVEEGYAAEIDAEFYPSEKVPPPFVTLAKKNAFSVLSKGMKGDPDLELYSASFYFLVGLVLATIANERTVENVKWGSGGARYEDAPLRAYLSALKRYILCEARAAGVGDVTVNWSYPLALSKPARVSMQDFWTVGAGQKGVGEKADPTAQVKYKANPGISESEAICRYLTELRPVELPTLASALSIAVDIGGGSSDIAFWTQGKMLEGVSMRLAGNDLLRPMINLNKFPEVIAKLCVGGLDEVGRKALHENPPVTINLLLTEPSRHGRGADFVARALSKSEPKGEAPWVYARSLIYIFAMGLSYYSGLHARKHLTEFKQVGIYFGGLGSLLISWLGNASKVNEILSFAIKEGLKLETVDQSDIDVKLYGTIVKGTTNAKLKEEAACGLLSPRIALVGNTFDPETTIVGEIGCKESGDVLGWDTRISAEKMKKLEMPPNLESTYIAQFLANVLPQCIEELALDQEGLRALSKRGLDRAKVEHYLALATGQELQPVFVYELRAVMDQYISSMSQGESA